VVKVSAAGCGVKNTASVRLEGTFVGFNEDRERLFVEGGLHLGDVVGRDGSVCGDSDAGVRGGRILAAMLGGLLTRNVGVGILELSVVGLVVVHGTLRVATIASIGAIVSAIGAVDKLLLREGEEFSSGDEVGTLERSGGGEGPA
jgi:hypothetical protein